MAQFAFKKTGDADYPRYLNILLQGPPKSGKTSFVATAPNVVVAAAEAGLMSIAHLNIPYVEIDGTDKLQTLLLVLNDESLRNAAAAQMGIPRIDTVAIDTLDAWQEILMKEILKENRRTSMQRDDWGTLKERMAAVLKAFVALPINVIFTVHTTTTQDDEGRMIYAPGLQGSIKDSIAGLVDFSLLAFRVREVDAQGQPTINYYLKNEGDLKNPTLGNRAAGRVPEVCVPQFTALHAAVFNGITPATAQLPAEVVVTPEPEQVVVDTPVVGRAIAPPPPAPPAPVVPAEQPVEQLAPAPAPVSAPAPAPAPAAKKPVSQAAHSVSQPATPGVPTDDSNNPINASGLTMLTKSYLANGLVLPDDVKTWTLAKARLVAKYFVAWRADQVLGRNPTRDDLVAYLQAVDAWQGELSGIQTGVQNIAVPEKPAHTSPSEVITPSQASEGTSTSAPSAPTPATDGEAIALIEQQLGAVQIGHEVAKGAKCEDCGKPVDDIDVANLALTRFKRVLCIKDYKIAGAAKAAAHA